jgi:UDP-N-acetylmuramoyl-tripeptide--D-alanyl-D-alanine ligase
MKKIIQWWMTPKFPLIHLKDSTNCIKKWIFHSIKRRLAKWYLKFLQKFTDIRVVMITGSAGKTTTKEMLASILKTDQPTIYSKENIDPVYNIPTTILKTPFGTKYLILETGVEYPGEMDFYLWLANPDIGVITNIFPTHLEFLGDINGVLEEKAKLIFGLSGNDIAVLNAGDAKLKDVSKNIKAKIMWFKGGGNPILQDSLAAEAVAKSLGIGADKIKMGLASYQKPKHRLSVVKLGSGAVVLDDSYNSNPGAAFATLKFFEDIARGKRKIAVLGDMKELGIYEEEAHRKIGKKVAEMNFECVIGVGNVIKYLIGEIGKNTKTYVVENQEAVLPLLKPYLQKGNYILIKGSRSIGLDKLVDRLV